jgi:holin-like protein
VARGLQLPVPGPVVGLLFLFLVLWFRSSTPANLTEAATALHSHLSLLFVPAGVGVMLYFPALAREWLVILVAIVVSTLVGLGVTV